MDNLPKEPTQTDIDRHNLNYGLRFIGQAIVYLSKVLAYIYFDYKKSKEKI